MYNSGSALVHLKGKDANKYIKHEFDSYPMGVYEISDRMIDKQKVIDYYAEEMKTYNIPAEKVEKHAPTYAHEENGSSAVKYKPYWLTPTGCENENCTSVVTDGLRAGGVGVAIPAVPWLMNEALWEMSLYNDNVTNVTDEARNAANNNYNSDDMPVINSPEIVITPESE